MEVTDVRIRLVYGHNAERLRAFATITLDREFVVRDMKVIEGNNGIFVAMPSRKIMTRCQRCNAKNYIRAGYCNECGKRMKTQQPEHTLPANKEHVDVAHPITQACRDRIHLAVINAFNKEALAKRNRAQPVSTEGETSEESPKSADADDLAAVDDRFS